MKKPDDGKPNRKSALLGCGCLMSPFLLLLVLIFGTLFYNNFRLWRLERNFAVLPHPASSKFIKRQKMVGLVAGNGNHCDFFVAELRSHAQTRAQIEAFYASKRVAVPNDDGSEDVKNGTQSPQIDWLPSPLPSKYRWKYGHVDDWDLSALAGRENLYIALINNSGESWGWDSAFGACG